jgi:hypothetical protein
VEASVVLTNNYWFSFDYRGFVVSFTAATNCFSAQEDFFLDLPRHMGKSTLTTNEVVALARETLLKLGYQPAITLSDTAPVLEGPYDLQGGHIPYCRVLWEPIKEVDSDAYSRVRVEINTQQKTVVGLYLEFAHTNKIGTPLKIDVQPELESEFRKRTKSMLHIRTNDPPRLPPSVLPVR